MRYETKVLDLPLVFKVDCMIVYIEDSQFKLSNFDWPVVKLMDSDWLLFFNIDSTI